MKNRASPFRVVIFLAAAAGFVWFLIPIGWHVLNIGNASGLAVCLAVMVLTLFWGRIRAAGARSRAVRWLSSVAAVLLCVGAIWSVSMTVCMLSTMSSAAPPENAVVVILGSMVDGTSPSADLWTRIDTAAAYLKTHPGAKCIASGGQGRGESITEASAIKKYLIADGIDPARILTEEASHSTQENIVNSRKIADANGFGRKMAIVTDDYHEYRANSIARESGVEPYAVPAHTPWYILSSCWAREVLALTKYLVFRF